MLTDSVRVKVREKKKNGRGREVKLKVNSSEFQISAFFGTFRILRLRLIVTQASVGEENDSSLSGPGSLIPSFLYHFWDTDNQILDHLRIRELLNF